MEHAQRGSLVCGKILVATKMAAQTTDWGDWKATRTTLTARCMHEDVRPVDHIVCGVARGRSDARCSWTQRREQVCPCSSGIGLPCTWRHWICSVIPHRHPLGFIAGAEYRSGRWLYCTQVHCRGKRSAIERLSDLFFYIFCHFSMIQSTLFRHPHSITLSVVPLPYRSFTTSSPPKW